MSRVSKAFIFYHESRRMVIKAVVYSVRRHWTGKEQNGRLILIQMR